VADEIRGKRREVGEWMRGGAEEWGSMRELELQLEGLVRNYWWMARKSGIDGLDVWWNKRRGERSDR
jgi:hypothetical protein